MPRRKMGSPFLTSPTVVVLPGAKTSLGEFKFTAREAFPREHLVSVEGYIDGATVYVEEFVENIEYRAGRKGNWLDYPDEAVTRAKQSAAGKQRVWLGTLHSHPYGVNDVAIDTMSETDHVSGHFHGESISAIYTISKSKKNGRLYSRPIRWFVPQGRIQVL